jgi:hypothetical protein
MLSAILPTTEILTPALYPISHSILFFVHDFSNGLPKAAAILGFASGRELGKGLWGASDLGPVFAGWDLR